jgi:hypothetical protein
MSSMSPLPVPRLLVGLLLMATAGAASQEPSPTQPPPRPDDEPVLGAPSGFDLGAAPEQTAWIPAGRRLHQSPEARSPVIQTLDAAGELPLLQRLGDWAEVRYGSRRGWVWLGEGAPPAAADDPQTGLAPESVDGAPQLPARAPWPDPARLESVEALIGPAVGHLGPWRLYTDRDDARLLATLDRIARHLPDGYRECFHLDPGSAGEAAIALIDDPAAYEQLAKEAGLGGLGLSGHSGGGVSAVSLASADSAEDLEALTVHELTHLLNQRALGPELPPWLDEGMADHLAHLRTGRDGRLLAGSLRGDVLLEREPRPVGPATSRRHQVVYTGPRADLRTLLLAERSPGGLPLLALLELPHQRFVEPETRHLHYAASAFFVRFLLAGERAAAFHSFLAAVAAGGRADGAALAAALGVDDWEELEGELQRWLWREATLHGVQVMGNGPPGR